MIVLQRTQTAMPQSFLVLKYVDQLEVEIPKNKKIKLKFSRAYNNNWKIFSNHNYEVGDNSIFKISFLDPILILGPHVDAPEETYK